MALNFGLVDIEGRAISEELAGIMSGWVEKYRQNLRKK